MLMLFHGFHGGVLPPAPPPSNDARATQRELVHGCDLSVIRDNIVLLYYSTTILSLTPRPRCCRYIEGECLYFVCISQGCYNKELCNVSRISNAAFPPLPSPEVHGSCIAADFKAPEVPYAAKRRSCVLAVGRCPRKGTRNKYLQLVISPFICRIVVAQCFC